MRMLHLLYSTNSHATIKRTAVCWLARKEIHTTLYSLLYSTDLHALKQLHCLLWV